MQAGIAVTVALAEKEGVEISKVPAKAVASELVYEAEITVQHIRSFGGQTVTESSRCMNWRYLLT